MTFFSSPFDNFIAIRIGNDFLPSRKSFPTGFFVILGSPITPIKSSVIWNAIPKFLPNDERFKISLFLFEAQIAPIAQDTSNNAAVFFPIIVMYSVCDGIFFPSAILISSNWPSQISTQALANLETSCMVALDDNFESEIIWNAFENNTSPARIASGIPYFLWTVGTPWRISSLSIMSSWTKLKLWTISTALAAPIALELFPPTIWQLRITMYGLNFLPPWIIKCPAAS